MNAPRRWKDSPGAPIGVGELLRSAKKSAPMSDASFVRGAASVKALGAAPTIASGFAAISAKVALTSAFAVVATGAALVAIGSPLQTALNRSGHAESTAGLVNVSQSLPSVRPITPSSAMPAPTTQRSSDSTDDIDTRGTSQRASDHASIRQAPHAPRGAPLPSQSAPRVEPAIEPIAAAPALIATTSTPAPSAIASESRAASDLGPELAALSQARAELSRNPSRALALVSDARARFPSGVLSAERDLIELDALRRAGKIDAARTRGRAWLARDPSGLYAARVRSILAAIDPP